MFCKKKKKEIQQEMETPPTNNWSDLLKSHERSALFAFTSRKDWF